MRAKRLLGSLIPWAIGSVLVLTAADDAKKIEYSTTSEEAKQLIEQIARGIENSEPRATLAQWGQKLIEADPNWAFGHMYASQFQQPQQGTEMLQKAQELSSGLNEGEKRYLEGVLAIRQNDAPKALEIFKGLAADYPGERRAHMLVGQLALNSDPDLACSSFKRAKELDTGTARIHGFIGNCLILEGRYQEAERGFRRGMVSSSSFSFPIYLGNVFVQVYQGDINQALTEADIVREAYLASPNGQAFPPVFLHNLKARIALEHGRYETALKSYEAGLKSIEGSSLPPQQMQTWTARYHHGRGRTLAKMGKHDEAWKEAEFIKSQIDAGGDAGVQFIPAYHYLAGYLKLEAGETEKAIEHLINSNPIDPFHRLLLARAYLKTGQREKALEIYKVVTSFNQNNMERALAYPEAARMLKQLGG